MQLAGHTEMPGVPYVARGPDVALACSIQTSGSQCWKHGGPPRSNLNILAAHPSTLNIYFFKAQALNSVKINSFCNFLKLLQLIWLIKKIIFVKFLSNIIIFCKISLAAHQKNPVAHQRADICAEGRGPPVEKHWSRESQLHVCFS